MMIIYLKDYYSPRRQAERRTRAFRDGLYNKNIFARSSYGFALPLRNGKVFYISLCLGYHLFSEKN